MTNIGKQISEWDIETIEKRLIQIQAAADGDYRFSHSIGIETLAIAQRAVELVKIEQGLKKGYYDEAVEGWSKYLKLSIIKGRENVTS